MIAYLSGKIIAKKENFVILEVNGVGYEVYFSQKSVQKLPAIGEKAEIFCYLEVNERGVKLLGFLCLEELEFFKILRAIQGLGPKACLEIASIGPLETIRKQLEKGDTEFLEDLPGIGKKKAQKIILELSGKFKAVEAQKQKEPAVDEEALSALTALGFSKNQAKEALSQVPPGIEDGQARVKQALQILGK